MKSGFLSKKIVPSVFLSIISVAIIDSFYSAPANAGWLTGGLAVTTAGSAVAAGIAGTPVAGAAVLGVGATAEIGVSYMCGLLGFGDPPDLINYALKADPLLIIPSFSTDPTASTELNQAAIGVITAVSVVS